MAESLKPEWRVLTTEDGHVIYHNDITGEETRESPYLAQLNKYRNCDNYLVCFDIVLPNCLGKNVAKNV